MTINKILSAPFTIAEPLRLRCQPWATCWKMRSRLSYSPEAWPMSGPRLLICLAWDSLSSLEMVLLNRFLSPLWLLLPLVMKLIARLVLKIVRDVRPLTGVTGTLILAQNGPFFLTQV